MSDPEVKQLGELKVDADNLYREEIFTDLRVATLRRLTPIKADGSPDPSREVRFLAETQILSQAGPLPVQASIQATSLEEAMEKFPDAVNAAVERLMDEARELQRQEASRIVIPGVSSPPGVGKIHLG